MATQIEWHEEYNIGISSIDKEHQQQDKRMSK